MNYSAIAAPEPGAALQQGGSGGGPAKPNAAPAAGGRAPPPGANGVTPPQLGPQQQEIMERYHAHGTDRAETESFYYKRRLILKIRQYATAFEEEIGSMVSAKVLEDMGEKQLESLLQEIKFTVGSRASSIVTNQLAGGGVTALEDFLKNKMNYEVMGPELHLQQIMGSKDFQYLVKEMTLEYMDIVYTRPEIRMGFFLFNTVQTMDTINRRSIEQGGLTGVKRKEPDSPVRQQDGAPPPPPQRTDPGGSVTIAEIPAAPMPAVPPPDPAAPAVVVPAVLRQPAPVPPKPKPAPAPKAK